MWQQQPLRWDTEYQCEMNFLAFASCNSVRRAWESPGGCDSFSEISIFFVFRISAGHFVRFDPEVLVYALLASNNKLLHCLL